MPRHPSKGRGKHRMSSVVPTIDNLMYDHEFIYNMLHDRTDKNGFLIMSMHQFTKVADLSDRNTKLIFKKFIKAGLIAAVGGEENYRMVRYRLLVHPDDVDWEAFYKLVRPSKNVEE